MNEHHDLCASPEWRAHVHETVLPRVLAEVDLGDHLLEVGPGFGATTDWLRAHVAELTAVEVDAELAEPLERRYEGTNVQIVRGDATALDLEPDTFSAGVSFFMLHHVPGAAEQDRLFAELARVLRPGAPVVAVDSVHSPELETWHVGDTYVPIDPAGLADRLGEAGLTDVQVEVRRDTGWIAYAHKPLR